MGKNLGAISGKLVPDKSGRLVYNFELSEFPRIGMVSSGTPLPVPLSKSVMVIPDAGSGKGVKTGSLLLLKAGGLHNAYVVASVLGNHLQHSYNGGNPIQRKVFDAVTCGVWFETLRGKNNVYVDARFAVNLKVQLDGVGAYWITGSSKKLFDKSLKLQEHI